MAGKLGGFFAFETDNTQETEATPRKLLKSPDLRRHQHSVSVRYDHNYSRNSIAQGRTHKSASPASDDCSRLRQENLSLQQTILSLRKQLSTSPITSLTLTNYEQELALKTLQIQQIKANYEQMWTSKVRRLEEKLNETKAELINLRNKNEEINKKPSSLYEIIGILQSENKKLKEELTRKIEEWNLKETEKKMREMENLQEKLLAENQRLREQLEQSSDSLRSIQRKVSIFSASLSACLQDLSQIAQVVKLMQDDAPLTAEILMQQVRRDGRREDMSVEGLMEWTIEHINTTVQELRQSLLSLYTESSSHTCTSQ